MHISRIRHTSAVPTTHSYSGDSAINAVDATSIVAPVHRKDDTNQQRENKKKQQKPKPINKQNTKHSLDIEV